MLTNMLNNIASLKNEIAVKALSGLQSHTVIKADDSKITIVNNVTKMKIHITPPKNEKDE